MIGFSNDLQIDFNCAPWHNVLRICDVFGQTLLYLCHFIGFEWSPSSLKSDAVPQVFSQLDALCRAQRK